MKLLTATLALLLSAGLAAAQNSVSLEWDPNPPAEGVSGYRIYQKITTPAPGPIGGTTPPPAITWKLVGTATEPKFTVPNVPAGTTTYTVTAFNPGGESGRSNEAQATLLSAPAKLRVVTVIVTP